MELVNVGTRYYVTLQPDSITIGVDDITLGVFTPASMPDGAKWVFNHLDVSAAHKIGTESARHRGDLERRKRLH